MNKRELQQLVKLGEDSGRQFKADVTNPDSLAAELVAFSNSRGGTILIGVADDGTLVGLSPQDVRRINQPIGNSATQGVRSPISPRTENVSVGKQRTVVAVTVPEGLDKSYFDRKGVIWLKAGADKRRVQSKEELRRLFQDVDLLQADQVPTGAGVDELDRLRFRDFLSGTYHETMPEDGEPGVGILRRQRPVAVPRARNRHPSPRSQIGQRWTCSTTATLAPLPLLSGCRWRRMHL